jgi:hypothetical protein
VFQAVVGSLNSDVAVRAAERLASVGPCAHYLKDITCWYHGGVLTLAGRIPTHRLKRTLQWILADLDGVDHVEDQVDVISSDGLSCIHNLPQHTARGDTTLSKKIAEPPQPVVRYLHHQ